MGSIVKPQIYYFKIHSKLKYIHGSNKSIEPGLHLQRAFDITSLQMIEWDQVDES